MFTPQILSEMLTCVCSENSWHVSSGAAPRCGRQIKDSLSVSSKPDYLCSSIQVET